MEARRAIFGSLAALAIGAGAWLRGASDAAEMRSRAALDAAPKTEGAALAEHVRADNEGRLVLLQGLPEIVVSARDDSGKVVTPDSLVLETRIERFERHKDRDANGRTRYVEEWTSSNGGTRWFAQARIGAFELEPTLLDGLESETPYALDTASLERLAPAAVIGPSEVFHGGGTPSTPHVGDLKVRYTHAPLAPISLLARQQGERLVRDTQPLTVLGVSFDFDFGVAQAGARDHAAMLDAQRRRIEDGARGWRTGGLVLIALGGLFAVGAFGALGPTRPIRTRFAQFALCVAWLFAGLILAPIERAFATLTDAPLALVVGVAAIVAALAAALVVAHRAIDRAL